MSAEPTHAADAAVIPALAWAGLVAGPILAALVYAALPAAQFDEAGKVVAGLTAAGRATGAVAVLMAIWWLTEAVPIEAASLLPLVLFPLLGIATIDKAAAPYASEQVYLFMGGFLLGLAMERWGLHKRVALITMAIVGTGPARLVGGLMLATALISLWVNNTATCIVMLPIGMSVVALASGGGLTDVPGSAPKGDNFAMAVLLGIAYAASIGGVGTLVGTAPNLLLAGFVERTYGQPLSFNAWLWVGIPAVAIFLPAAWLLLTYVIFPLRDVRILDARGLIRSRLAELGPTSWPEWATFVVFITSVVWWVFRRPLCDLVGLYTVGADGKPVYPLSDAGIAVTAGLLLFLIPVDFKKRVFVMDWPTAKRLPWGVLLLFGGGLSLAAAMSATGVDVYIGSLFSGLASVPFWVILVVVVASVVFLSELASNTALTATMLPIMHAVETRLGLAHGMLLVPMTMAASCGFMLPVATPPNALAFATGRIPMRRMCKAGLVIDLVGIAVTVGVCLVFGARALHIPAQ